MFGSIGHAETMSIIEDIHIWGMLDESRFLFHVFARSPPSTSENDYAEKKCIDNPENLLVDSNVEDRDEAELTASAMSLKFLL